MLRLVRVNYDERGRWWIAISNTGDRMQFESVSIREHCSRLHSTGRRRSSSRIRGDPARSGGPCLGGKEGRRIPQDPPGSVVDIGDQIVEALVAAVGQLQRHGVGLAALALADGGAVELEPWCQYSFIRSISAIASLSSRWSWHRAM